MSQSVAQCALLQLKYIKDNEMKKCHLKQHTQNAIHFNKFQLYIDALNASTANQSFQSRRSTQLIKSNAIQQTE